MPYHGYYYGIDMYYIVLVLPCVLFAFWAQNKVNSTFNRYSRVQNLRGLTGAQAAEAVLRYNGVSGVRIEYVSGKPTILTREAMSFGCRVRCTRPRRWRPSALPRMRQGMRCSTPSAMRRSSCARRSSR